MHPSAPLGCARTVLVKTHVLWLCRPQPSPGDRGRVAVSVGEGPDFLEHTGAGHPGTLPGVYPVLSARRRGPWLTRVALAL